MRSAGRIVAGRQIRAARALLGWSRDRLADAAGLHPNAVAYWEQAAIIPTGRREPNACTRIRAALHDAGVEFIGHAKPGARLARNANYAPRPPLRARARHGVKLISSDWTALVAPKTRAIPAAAAKLRSLCGAKTRGGAACRRPALANGRCRNHGGASTGPTTAAGRKRIAEVQRQRWAEWRSRQHIGRTGTLAMAVKGEKA